jgi:hypothetical protein
MKMDSGNCTGRTTSLASFGMGNVSLVYLGCSYKHSIRPFMYLLSTASATGKRLGGIFRPMELIRKRTEHGQSVASAFSTTLTACS